ncbi:MAG: 16S rRNA (guanine(527)-N(7))-methyltransferase RsmG [Rhodoferax sp.]|nr:16S rRNA (guanine(527)-N(7))-methyltransferase RsmG [Rhodoferax sp.]MCF8209462.1 16S rRNA (guanine(527)-N(7))-methyltransferase RsmG [Rhodoferax sp.]
MLTLHLLDSLAVIPPLKFTIEQLISGCSDGGDSSSEGSLLCLRGQIAPDAPTGEQSLGAATVAVGPVAGLQSEPHRPHSLATLRFLDVGSGAGLPGVVIAICCPELRVDCVDTVGKKAAFIQQVAVSLKLPGLRGVHARVEALTGRYDLVSSRAFASLADFVSLSARALEPGGVWMALKGKHPAAEIAALPALAEVFHVEQLKVPGLDADRCIVWMRAPAEAAGGLVAVQ